MDVYRLNEQGEPVPCDITEWGAWFEKADRVVKVTHFKDTRVSTVFLGFDHSFQSNENPVLWETMVFGGSQDQDICKRCTGSYQNALAMHDKVLEQLGLKELEE